MRTTTTATVVLAAALLAAPTAELIAQSDEAAVKAVKSVRDDYFASYEAGTPEKGAQQFAQDGVLLPPASPSAQGREAIVQQIQGLTDGLTVSLQAISEQTRVMDGAVLDRGILGVETTPEGSDETSTDTGKYVLLAEQRNGSWKLVWLIWNTDHPLRIMSTEEE